MRAAPSAPSDPPPTPFLLIGGRETIRHLSDAFYDLIDSEAAYAELRALHAADLTATRASLTDFLAAWLGGPLTWFEERPRMCIMSMHRAIPTTAATAAQWLSAMAAALDQTGVEATLRATILQGLLRMTRQMTG